MLLIEAGGDRVDDRVVVPALWPELFTSDWDWDYWSEPEPHLLGRRNYLPRGKGLGGTSAINGLLYVRGVPADFDEWAAAGHRGWSWSDVAALLHTRRTECPRLDQPSMAMRGRCTLRTVSRRTG